MIIDCIADLHGHLPSLEGGDMLIVAGDLTRNDSFTGYFNFFSWLQKQEYNHKIVVAGNHDKAFEEMEPDSPHIGDIIYLRDAIWDCEGFRVWGSPWTPIFDGVNPRCDAFMAPERLLNRQFDLIPDDIDVLITHGPPWKFLDTTIDDRRVGSQALLNAIGRVRPTLHVFGHIHESYGEIEAGGVHFVNCSYVNECYLPVNKPIRVIL